MRLILFKIAIGLLFCLGIVGISTGNPLHKLTSAVEPDPGIQNIDITHQNLHLKVDPSKRYINGFVQTTFKPVHESITSIVLDLHNDLIIDSVLSQNKDILEFTRNNDHTTLILLPDSLAIAQTTTISIYYQGVPPEDGFGAFVQTRHGDDPIIWTLSEPYGARNWWPCGQNLYDKIDSLDLWISVPSGYRVAGNGLLVSEKPADGNTITYHWQHRYPIATYLVAFAVTNYRVHRFEVELTNGTLPVVDYLYPEDFDRHSASIEDILPEMMQLYEKLFIPYPFGKEKYGHAQFGFGGGMEHQTMSFMVNFSYELTAHELAHQWFGDYVTCGSWQDVWLNEGFASYLTGLTYERILQNGSWENYLTSSIRDITSSPVGTLIVNDTTSIDRIFSSRLSYKKGAMVLHMLRWILGDEHFFEGIQNYLLDENTQYAFGRTLHLIDHLEKISGINLDQFFSNWYEGEGYPSYHLQWKSTITGVNIVVNQSTSHPSVSYFKIPLEIGIYGTEKDTLVRLNLEKNDQKFEFPLTWEVESIEIDPNHWIISAQNTVNVVTGSKAGPDQSKVRIFPNPSHGEISIENRGDDTIRCIAIYSATGMLKSQYKSHILPDHTQLIQFKNSSPGLYFINIQTLSGNMSNHKIILN